MFEKESLKKCKDILDLGGTVILGGHKITKVERFRQGEHGIRYQLIRINPYGGLHTYLLNALDFEEFIVKVEEYFKRLEGE